MTNSAAILDHISAAPKGETFSTEQLADHFATPAPFVQGMCIGLRGEGYLRLVSQTTEDETPHRGVISGGNPSDRTQWYEATGKKKK